jgi:membrane protease YdiL (CAAX protease family)
VSPPDAPLVKRPDRVRALLAAGVCALLYWVTLNLIVSPIAFIAGRMVAVTLSTLLAGSISGALAMAIFESRKLTDIGLAWHNGAGRNVLLGIVLAAAGALLTVLPGLAVGMAHFETIPNADVSARAAFFTPLLLLCGAAGEEIAFRGFALQYLMRAWGAWAGICGIGALFGALHALNPSASTLGVLNTAGFGVLFGYALLRTHDLWLPIGLHFGWNATLPFLGVELSGLTIRVTRYRLIWTSGELWSGGAYGPEASLLATGVLVILFLAVWRMPVHRGSTYLLDSAEVE